jgi:ankyrin repeat protein
MSVHMLGIILMNFFNSSCKFLVLLGLTFVLLFVSKSQAASSLSNEDLLIKAAKENDIRTASILMGSSLDVNATDNKYRTALYHASSFGYIEIVEILCLHKDIDVNVADEYGHTALMMAAFNGHIEVVKMLLRRQDINLSAIDLGGDTALSHAQNGNHPEIVQLLMDNGAV